MIAMDELDRLAAGDRAALSGVKQGDTAIAAILRILQRQTEIEIASAIAPGLGNEGRQFNAGRVAALKDAIGMLMESIPK
jgi:hypothetical protein